MRKLFALALIITHLPVHAMDFNDAILAHLTGQYDKAMPAMLALAEGSDHALAQYYVGHMYAHGQGVPQDYASAAAWFRRAAERGVPQAQFRLGQLYANGQGVPKDYEQAYAWFKVAAELEHPDSAHDLQQAAARLNDAELAAANELAADYLQKYGSGSKKPESANPPTKGHL